MRKYSLFLEKNSFSLAHQIAIFLSALQNAAQVNVAMMIVAAPRNPLSQKTLAAIS